MRRLMAVAGLAVALAARAQTAPQEVVNWTTGVGYTYDGSGNVVQVGEDRFGYDGVSRLTTAEVNGVARAYGYDAFGNRTGCTQQATDCQLGFTPNAANRLAQASYDDAGNVLRLGGHTFTWDPVDALARDASGGGARDFIYTASDERIAVYDTSSSTWLWTLRDGSGHVLRELTSSGASGTSSWQWARDYVYRDGLLLASRQPVAGSVSTYHYHLDHLGTPRRISDDFDRLAGFHDYHAFGPELPGGLTEPSPSSHRYTGQERDATNDWTGPLDSFHARSYSPVLGRFLSADPVLDIQTAMHTPQAWNRYAYVTNNPLRFTDPTGKVISYDDGFRKRLRTDKQFKAAFDAWKKTKAGAAQWTAMARDTDTVYTFKVGTVKAMTGVLKEEQANGMTLPIVSSTNENKAGKLDVPNVNMTINVDFIRDTHKLVPEATSRTMAKALFEEAQHGLDIGSSTMSAKQAWDAERRFHTDTEPRMKVFENELNVFLPPPKF